VKRLSLLTFFGAAKKECCPAQGSMKIKSKANIKPAVANAVGTPTREQTKNRRPRTEANEKKNINPTSNPAVAKAVRTSRHEHPNK
jgi:hypothetical protein